MNGHTSDSKLLPVTGAHPCPICERADWCSYSADGRIAICMRVADGRSSATTNGGHLHKLVTDPTPEWRSGEGRRCSATTSSACSSTGHEKATATDWLTVAARYAAALTPDARHQLAVSLRLPPTGLDRFPLVGFRADDRHRSCTTWSEMAAGGEVIGINRRWEKGEGPLQDGKRHDKMMIRGSKRGLTIPFGCLEITPADAPLFIVEGPTDCAAMTAAGLACIGRPSSSGGACLIAEFVRTSGAGRRFVIVGENDQKENAFWPGRQGAEAVAAKVAELTGRDVFVVLPPVGVKDAREWLTHEDRGRSPWEDRGRQLAAMIDSMAVAMSPPCNPAPTPEERVEQPDAPLEAADSPHRLAAAYLRHITPDGKPRTIHYHTGEFVEWGEGAYRPLLDAEVKGRLTTFVHEEFERVWEAEWQEWATNPKRDPRKEPTVRKVGVRLLADVQNALTSMIHLPADLAAPCWLDGLTGPEAKAVVAFPNGLLDLATRRFLPPTAQFFTFNSVGFEYDPKPPIPKRWIAFLKELWPDDPEAIQCLREWLAYLLTGDTSLQKMLLLIGPKRSGKGTILRVLKALIGERNFASPTLNSLAGEFGLSIVDPENWTTSRAPVWGV